MRYHVTVVFGLAAFLAAGCGPEKPAAPGTTPTLSDAEAQLVGHEVAGAVADEAAGFTIGGLFLPEFPSAGLVADDSGGTRTHSACPTITPFPPADADGDRVPDDVTLSFTLPDCSFTRDGATLEITGTIHVTDPSTTAFGVRVAFADLQHKVSWADGSFYLNRLNGARQVLRAGSDFSLHDSTTTDLESSQRGTARLVKAWVVTFTADPGQTFDHLRPLPSGELTVDGSLARTHGTETHAFAVTTVTPLHHDATCLAHPRCTSGELLITKTGPDATVTIHVVFTGCGVEPTVTVEHGVA